MGIAVKVGNSICKRFEAGAGSPASGAGCSGTPALLKEHAFSTNANCSLALENKIISIYTCVMRISRAYNAANASRVRAGVWSWR